MSIAVVDERTAKQAAMDWLESLLRTIEDGRLVLAPDMGEAERHQLAVQVCTLRAVVLPALHESLGTVTESRT